MGPVLVPVGLAPLGEVKLGVALERARATGAEVILLHVLGHDRQERDDRAGAGPEAEAQARAYLELLASSLRVQGVPARTLLRRGPVVPAVVDAAEHLGAALIVAGADARPALARLARGGASRSTAAQISRSAPCPVEVVPPKTHGERAVPVPRRFTDDARLTGPLDSFLPTYRQVDVARIVGTVGDAPPAAVSSFAAPAAAPSPQRLAPPYQLAFAMGAARSRAFLPMIPSMSLLALMSSHQRGGRAEQDAIRRARRASDRGWRPRPVELLKLAYGYYLVDGHLQVQAARQAGTRYVEARVTEYVPRLDTAARELLDARRRFEAATGLTQVGAALPDTYALAERLIEDFATRQRIGNHREAAHRWFETVFVPLQRRVRARDLHWERPGERSADVVVRAAQHDLATGSRSATWDDLVASFTAAFFPRALAA